MSKMRLQLTWYNKDMALIPTESDRYVFRPTMGYKAGLLVTRYLLRHRSELYERKSSMKQLYTD